MGPEQMMMYYLMQQQNGMGGSGQRPPADPAMAANPQMVSMSDQLRRGAAAGGPAPVSYQGGIIPMMAGGQMGTVGQDLARLAGPSDATGSYGVVPVTDVPQGKLGWMDQLGQYLDRMDPNMRLMMSMGGLQNLGRILGGGA